MTPMELFQLNARYLYDNGWVSDGDDPGIWYTQRRLTDWTFGEALEEQFELDGVSMQEPA